ncbi:hypothetical protein EC973_008773 [Apophysomyces ossiformis]|uniref:EF-hand domain-containing protein n=1 Tax=Apophysomyces ossiformis TaxID=679940 RepID=A0A8H7BN35_9FUNG|nr:hypothetical protein EC973_008773 [Apophysomyces ossiformis]
MQFTAEQLDELKAAFSDADREGNGRLDSEQLYQALRALGLEAPVMDIMNVDHVISFDEFKEIVADLMRSSPLDTAFDMLADMAKGGITLESLLLAHEDQKEEVTLEELQEMITEGDRNGDGVVDRDEFRRIWEKAGI